MVAVDNGSLVSIVTEHRRYHQLIKMDQSFNNKQFMYAGCWLEPCMGTMLEPLSCSYPGLQGSTEWIHNLLQEGAKHVASYIAIELRGS